MQLISLQQKGRIVFAGDTHGDLDASQKIIRNYLDNETRICFLGDYVDRGNLSKENIDFLLQTREKNPKQIYLTKGNHEAYNITPLYPADFWESLSTEEKRRYAQIFEGLPLAISVGKIIALHGALPDIENIKEIEQIKNKDKRWYSIIWGDFVYHNPNADGQYNPSGRPQFGEYYFNRVMNKINKQVLIRSHDPKALEKMFEDRCLTIFTSDVYVRRRTVAIADFRQKKKINTIDDLTIEEI